MAMSEVQQAAKRLRAIVGQHDAAVERYSKPEPNARVIVLRSDLAAVLDHIDEDWFGEWVATNSARIHEQKPRAYLQLVAEGWAVIESDGRVMTLQAPEELEGPGPREIVVNLDDFSQPPSPDLQGRE